MFLKHMFLFSFFFIYKVFSLYFTLSQPQNFIVNKVDFNIKSYLM